MSQKHTDTKKLTKGIKYLAFTVPLLFLSPYILTLSFLNKENFLVVSNNAPLSIFTY
jgi:hypothetical protein